MASLIGGNQNTSSAWGIRTAVVFILIAMYTVALYWLWTELGKERARANEATATLEKVVQQRETAYAENLQLQRDLQAIELKYRDLDGANRVLDAALRDYRAKSPSSVSDSRIRERDELLQRMASLGVRTSEALDRKQLALKNCVVNYANLSSK